MKKILLINDHIHFGGGGDAVLHLERRGLEEKGYEVFTISFGLEQKYTENNYVLKFNPNRELEKFNKFIYPSYLKNEFSNVVNSISPDLIHIHLIGKFPLAVYNSKGLNDIPVIQTLHGPNLFCASSWGGLKNSASCELGIGIKCYSRGCTNAVNTILYSQLKARYWNSLKTKINVFHCPSINILNVAKRLGFKNSVYIPLGIDNEFINEPVEVQKLRPTLLFAGAIAEQKGVQYLLPALQQVKEKFPDVLLRIAGRGHLLDKLKNDSKTMRLEENVEFLGFVSHEKIRDFYLSGHIFLMPSIWQEQFGLVGPEAFACKVPCIGTNVGGISEWLHHNENGLLIPPKDIDSLSEAIINLLSNNDKRKQMGENGRKYAIKNHHPQKYIDSIVNLINRTQ